MWNKYPAFKNVQIKLPPFENNINEYALSQFSEIENQNKISLVVYELFDHKNGKDMELSLIRKGKTNVPQERIIYLLQINKNHLCYIKNISIFLKRFYNAPKDREICRNCLVPFKNKSEYDDHVTTSKVCIYRIPFPTKIVLPPKNSKIS